MKRGTAVFGMPSGPIKCAGAPQKIVCLAADYWRQQGVLNDIRVVLVLPTPGMFGVPVFAKELERVAKGYGLEVHLSSEVVEVDPGSREVVVKDLAAGSQERIGYDVMHLVSPQSAPDCSKRRPWLTPTCRPATSRSTTTPCSTPVIRTCSRWGTPAAPRTARRAQRSASRRPSSWRTCVRILRKTATASYGLYASCPLTTARNKALLAEFDYTMEPKPSFPVIDTTKERKDMWLLKKYGLPALYWNLMLKGRA